MEPGSDIDRQYERAADTVTEAIWFLDRATLFPHQPRKENES
jgi:hypothetical protein